MKQKVITRFALSPTSPLDMSGARSALYSWLYAKRFGGKFVVSIEDIDAKGATQQNKDEILDSMKWLGLDWDDLQCQSKRLDIYTKEAKRLIDEGKAFKKNGAICVTATSKKVVVKDLIRGDVEFTKLAKKNEIIISSNGTPSSNFATVVDDAKTGVTHIVKGDDLLNNTPKQVLLYKALGYKPPVYSHIPLILAADGDKKSKQDGAATAVTKYREIGYFNDAIVNYLILLGWAPIDEKAPPVPNNVDAKFNFKGKKKFDGKKKGKKGPAGKLEFSRFHYQPTFDRPKVLELKDVIKKFDLKDMNAEGIKFDFSKFNWLNGKYLNRLPSDELFNLVLLSAGDERETISKDKVFLKGVIDLFKPKASFPRDIVDMSGYCFNDDFEYAPAVKKVLGKSLTKQFKKFRKLFEDQKTFKADKLEAAFKTLCIKQKFRIGPLFLPLRTAISGAKSGPSIFRIMTLIGKKRSLARIDRLIARWGK